MWPAAKMVHFTQAPKGSASFSASGICALGSALFKKLGSRTPRKERFRQVKSGILKAAIRHLGKLHLVRSASTSQAASVAREMPRHGTRAAPHREHTLSFLQE